MLLVSPMRNTAPAPTDENIPRANSPHTVQVTLTWPAENAAAAPRGRSQLLKPVFVVPSNINLLKI